MNKKFLSLAVVTLLAGLSPEVQARSNVDIGVGINTGPAYVVAPAPVYPAPGYVVAGPGYGPYCRPYRQTLTIAGETQVGTGTACLQPDGSWELVTPASGSYFNYVYRDDRVFFFPPRPFAGLVIRGGRHYPHGYFYHDHH